MTAPHITMRWHARAYRISQKSTTRQVAKHWIYKEVFGRKQSLADLLRSEGGGSSCWWHGVEWGATGGPGRGKIRARLARGDGYEAEYGTFSIKELYKEVLEEKQNPRLF